MLKEKTDEIISSKLMAEISASASRIHFFPQKFLSGLLSLSHKEINTLVSCNNTSLSFSGNTLFLVLESNIYMYIVCLSIFTNMILNPSKRNLYGNSNFL